LNRRRRRRWSQSISIDATTTTASGENDRFASVSEWARRDSWQGGGWVAARMG